MADTVPAKLRLPEIIRYVNRANQLRQVKPVIAYWCEYWVVNQILAKSLHNADDECLNYTTSLMDKLERTKGEHAGDDAITDDVAGQAYVEQFAQETFDRAERVLRANKVTRQTADTFDAAATFFSLVAIWGAPDGETQQKIKFAKWNATRILKAIKEGVDPNESNPKTNEDTAASAMPALDPNDPEVESIAGPSATVPAVPRPASVELVRRSGSPPMPTSPFIIEARSITPQERHPIQMQGYFDPPQPSPMSSPYQAPAGIETIDVSPPLPPKVSPGLEIAASPVPMMPSPYSQPNPQPTAPLRWEPTSTPPTQYPQSTYPMHPPPPQHQQPPPLAQGPPPSAWQPPALAHPPIPAPVPAPVRTTPSYAPSAAVDSRNISQAQKHAKWAVSALNFDDVPTAVKELRSALAALGVRQ